MQVTYKADSLTLDFLKLAQNGNPMLSIISEFEWQCRDIGPGMPLPYTSDGDSYIPVCHNHTLIQCNFYSSVIFHHDLSSHKDRNVT